jgi:crossover junction endodeoxyribonuclease RusA
LSNFLWSAALSLEPELPFEVVVLGTAMSLQASAHSKAAWKRNIQQAARERLPKDYWLLTSAISVTIFIFPGGVMRGDIDNRVKPILDAMTRFVYLDDGLVERVVVQKFEPGRIYPFVNPSASLASAMAASEPAVYIRITDDLSESVS